MKVKVTTIEEIDLTLDFPLYRRNSISFYKMIDETTTLQVCVFTSEIKPIDTQTAYQLSKDESTPDEFEQAYAEVLSRIQKLKEV